MTVSQIPDIFVMRRVSTILMFYALLAAGTAWLTDGAAAALAAGYGAAIVCINAWWLTRRLHQAERLPVLAVQATMRLFFRTALERLAIVITLFALGLVQWQLQAAPMLLSLAAGQIVLLFATSSTRLHLKTG